MSRVVGMEIGLPKCARVDSLGGQVFCSMQERDSGFRALDESSFYKYLGIKQCLGPKSEISKLRLRKELISRMKSIWSSELSAKQKVVTNTWAIAVYLYYLPLWKWGSRELLELDRTVRKIMCLNKAAYYGASVARFHIPRKLAGKGVMSLQDVYETSNGKF